MMPDWEYHLWSDKANSELMQTWFPQYFEDYLQLPAAVARIDVARCLYMHVHGGIYFDTDYKFFRPVDQSLLRHSCFLGIEELQNAALDGPKFGNAFLGSEPRHPLWSSFIESIFSRFRNGETKILYLGGPHALTRFLAANPQHWETVTLLQPSVLYPDFTKLKLSARRTKETLGVHLCWGSWRNKPLHQRVKNHARRLLSAL